MITEFVGEYEFLSNFYPCKIYLDRYTYPTLEHAYQAAKTTILEEREVIRNAKTPGIAKAMGSPKGYKGFKITLRSDWERDKVEWMRTLLRQKFSQPLHGVNPLRLKLLATAPRELIEGNWWHDTFWGVCNCGGKNPKRCPGGGDNMLGKMLMEVRRPPVSYCPECDGWPDAGCSHGRYTGPYLEF